MSVNFYSKISELRTKFSVNKCYMSLLFIGHTVVNMSILRMRNREIFLIFGYVFLQLGQGPPDLLRLALVVFSISCEEVVNLLLRKILG